MTRVFHAALRSLCLVPMIGCQAVPDRLPLQDFTPAANETGLVPTPNNCATPVNPFDAELSGFLADQVLFRDAITGFGTYEYKATEGQITAISLRVCEDGDAVRPSSERLLALNYYGIARLDVGQYEVLRSAEEDGGFVFAYTDAVSETAVNCGDQPSGTVTITESTFGVITGSFNILARCTNLEVLDRIPRETRFIGTFEAQNVGVE